MRGVKRCQGSTGRMKKHRDSNEFKVTAVKMANSRDIETKAVADTERSARSVVRSDRNPKVNEET